MKTVIIDNLEMLSKIDNSNLVSTYTVAGIIREIGIDGSFNANMETLKLIMEKRMVVVVDGVYVVNKHKIKEIMERVK